MMSHLLPRPIRDLLTVTAQRLEDGLQAESYAIRKATGSHPAFNEGYVESPLARSLIAHIVAQSAPPGLDMKTTGNGGCDLVNVYRGVPRRFRFRKALRDRNGQFDLRVGSDSRYAHRGRELTMSMFGDEPEPEYDDEQLWVLPYMLTSATLTLSEISAARVAALTGESSPYRLVLADIVRLDHAGPTPEGFRGGEDDLDLRDGQEGREDDGDVSPG